VQVRRFLAVKGLRCPSVWFDLENPFSLASGLIFGLSAEAAPRKPVYYLFEYGVLGMCVATLNQRTFTATASHVAMAWRFVGRLPSDDGVIEELRSCGSRYQTETKHSEITRW
jgi:hypothetical protein